MFPGVNGAPVLLVLDKFCIAKRMIEMIPERRAYDRVGIELGNRLAKRFRKRSDAAVSPFAVVEIVSRAGKRTARQERARNAVDGGAEQHGER